jgi:transposase
MNIRHATVGKIYCQFTLLKTQERKYRVCPQVCGMDGHTLHKGRKCITTFYNIERQKLFEVLQGKYSTDLLSFLSSLKGRHKVKIICIDFSSSYKHLLKEGFTNAYIVDTVFKSSASSSIIF